MKGTYDTHYSNNLRKNSNSSQATQEKNISSRVDSRLANKLREAKLFGALTEVKSPRFMKYLLQPKHILRNGWLLAPDLELDQRELRAYVLGHPGNANSVGQKLVIDRSHRVATLLTYAENEVQQIKVDMESMEVVENRFPEQVE